MEAVSYSKTCVNFTSACDITPQKAVLLRCSLVFVVGRRMGETFFDLGEVSRHLCRSLRHVDHWEATKEKVSDRLRLSYENSFSKTCLYKSYFRYYGHAVSLRFLSFFAAGGQCWIQLLGLAQVEH